LNLGNSLNFNTSIILEGLPVISEPTTPKRGSWAKCTHAKVVEHWVPGTHVTMMTHPHVNTLAAQLSQSLPPGKRKDLAG